MSWLKDLLKKTTIGVEEPQVVDYPVGQYKVYWEIMTNVVPGGLQSIIRFIGYSDFPLREEFTLVAPNETQLTERRSILIRDFMAKYKR